MSVVTKYCMSVAEKTDDVSSREHVEEYSWRYILDIARQHKAKLMQANMIALLAAVISVPVPLLMPLLVDEVLLHKPGVLVSNMDQLFPSSWHGPVLYIR